MRHVLKVSALLLPLFSCMVCGLAGLGEGDPLATSSSLPKTLGITALDMPSFLRFDGSGEVGNDWFPAPLPSCA
jgi:hypothetical protein